MKKIVATFLILVLALSLCACSKGEDTTSDTVEVILEEVVVDETGNQISDKEETTSSNQEVSSNLQTDIDDEGNEYPVIVDYNTVVEVDICDDIIRAYLNATNPTQQYNFLSQYDKVVMDFQKINLSWKGDGSTEYKLYVSENADFSNAHISKINGTYEKGYYTSGRTNTICVPGKTYYWKVIGTYSNDALGGGKIKVKDQPVRWIKIDGVSNVRDMGGWKTTGGKTVQYGKIYRGARLDNISTAGIETLKTLGIKTDVDIRSTAEWDSYGPVEKTGLKYYFFDTSAHYDYVLGGGSSEKEIRENYPKMFELLADESNYPIYLHCNYGNDRTGSMAFILNGLLGVTYEDLTRDYELTSYAFENDRRWRGNGTGGTFGPDDLIQENISGSYVDGRWGMMNKAFMESDYCTDGTLATAIENFLLARGVKKEHIEAYKNIMLK